MNGLGLFFNITTYSKVGPQAKHSLRPLLGRDPVSSSLIFTLYPDLEPAVGHFLAALAVSIGFFSSQAL